MLEPEQRLDHLSTVLDNSTDAIITIDSANAITSWNHGAELLYGYSSEEALSKQVSIITTEEQLPKWLNKLREVLQEQKAAAPFLNEQKSSDGLLLTVESRITPIYDTQQFVIGASIVSKDVSEQQHFREQLDYMSEHDALTGLYNRTYLGQQLDKCLYATADGGVGGVLMLLDIDNFKLINDAYGHETGDSVLRALAKELENQTGDKDLVAHFGGDEFAVLLPQRDQELATLLAKRLMESIPSTFWQQFRISVTLSIGMAAYTNKENKKTEEVIAAADMALFEAKEDTKGKNGMSTYDSAKATRFNWAEKIRRALDNGQLALYAQPIMDVKTAQIVQHELLLRMNDPDEGVVAPGPFLAVAERLGLIGEIDRWVVRNGIQFAASGHPVEINLSGDSMTDQEMLKLIAAELKHSQVDPSIVTFEITETAAIANLQEAIQFANQLRQLGCKFALDDFGTGFGSFIYLKHLPVSILKIDGEFIHQLKDSEVDQRIVRAIVYIAEALGKQTVAEWVGDQETLQLLSSLNVDYAQGYYVGKPQPISTL